MLFGYPMLIWLSQINHCVSDNNFDPKVNDSLVTRLGPKAAAVALPGTFWRFPNNSILKYLQIALHSNYNEWHV